MPKGKKTRQVSSPEMIASDEREHQSAYITDDGRHFRVLYNPDVHDPRWFVRSFVVDPDGSPVDIWDYPERFFEEQAAWEWARQAADAG